MNQKDELKCGNCIFYNEGYCRRYPPTVYSEAEDCTSNSHPRMYEHEWCGEFKHKNLKSQLFKIMEY